MAQQGGGTHEQTATNLQQQQLYPPPPPYFALAASGQLRPPPPVTGTYQLFGELFTTEDGLPPLQVRRLFDSRPDGSVDYRAQLLALHKELVANFLELLVVLVERPSGYARQVENVGLVLRNMQYLANQLRPHQARATLVDALEHSRHSRESAAEQLRAAGGAADAALAAATQALQAADAGSSGGGYNKSRP